MTIISKLAALAVHVMATGPLKRSGRSPESAACEVPRGPTHSQSGRRLVESVRRARRSCRLAGRWNVATSVPEPPESMKKAGRDTLTRAVDVWRRRI